MFEGTVRQNPAHQPAEITGQTWTVLGPVNPAELGLVDAHPRLWIEVIPGNAPGSPVLDDRAASLKQLLRFRRAGGGAIVYCQPYGCGRNGRVLADLSLAAETHIIAWTGFHLRQYYPARAATWSWTKEQAINFFIAARLARPVMST